MASNFTLDDIELIKSLIQANATSVGKEITDLSVTDKIEKGDIMLVRKTQVNEDKSISYDNFLKSIGNTAIDGFIASTVVDRDNTVRLTSANLVKVDKYYDGMKLSFISPIKNTGQYEIQVDSLAFIPLYAYKTTDTAVVAIDDYVEAVYVANKNAFFQINKNNLVYTNDYIYETHEFAQGDVATTIYLTSAFGARKTQYYDGMTINFICPIDTKGFVRINIDGLGVKDIVAGDVDDLIYSPLWDGQFVQATFDGESFKHNEYKTHNPKINFSVSNDLVVVGEEEIKINETEVVKIPIIEVVQPPQNVVDYTIGATGKFQTLSQAIDACIKEFGKDGGGRKVNLTFISPVILNFTRQVDNTYVDTYIKNMDLSWITIQALDSRIQFVLDGNDRSVVWIFLDKSTINFAENITVSTNTTKSLYDISNSFAALVRCYNAEFTLKKWTINITVYKNHLCVFDFSNAKVALSNVNINANVTAIKSYSGHIIKIINTNNCNNVELNNCNFNLNNANADNGDNFYGIVAIYTNLKLNETVIKGYGSSNFAQINNVPNADIGSVMLSSAIKIEGVNNANIFITKSDLSNDGVDTKQSIVVYTPASYSTMNIKQYYSKANAVITKYDYSNQKYTPKIITYDQSSGFVGYAKIIYEIVN